ncbi:MAG: hypothetical protein QG639_208 [Patescibacteria group bacterium]|nr:hypothetical protein [Patescibacteria group bacterium]
MSSKFQIFKLPLLTVLLVAVLLRLPLLNGSFWLDEAAQALESARPFSQQLLIRGDFQPPLLHYLIHFALYISDSEWWLRTVGALIPGIVTVFFTYQLGLLLGNKKTALMAALLLATSSFHIFYSQELRQYSLPALFAIASWYMLIKAWKSDKELSISKLLLFTLLQAAGLYSSYLFPFSQLGQIAWLLYIHPKHVGRWLAGFFGSALLFLPWVPYFLDQLSAGTELRSALPGWETVVSPTQLRALPLVISKFVYGIADVEVNLLYVAISIAIAASLGVVLFSKKFTRAEFTALSPVIFWLVIPIIFSWLISFYVPVLQPKRVLFCLPAFYLLVSMVALNLRSRLKQPVLSFLTPLMLMVLLSINIFTVTQYWTKPVLQRENWKQMVSDIEADYPESSVAVFSFTEAFSPWRWYASDTFPTLPTYEIFLTEETAIATVKQATRYDFVITFDYLADLTDPNRMLHKQLVAYGYKEIEVIDYPVIGFVRIYSKPEAVISYR